MLNLNPVGDMEIKAKEITLFPTAKLSHYPKNVNKHTDEQIDRLVELIEYHGHRDPLIVDSDVQPDGTHWVMAGNGRLQAAKREGWEFLPVIFQVFKSEDDKYSFMVSHNAIGASSWGGGLDFKQINLDLADLGPINIDHLGIKDFVVEPLEKFEPQADEDEVPEVVHPITRRGDIWLLGSHRLMCGDSTMIDDVKKLLNNQSPNTMITDPPYGVKYEAGWRAVAKGVKKTEREESSNLQNDDRADWYDAWVLFPGNIAYVWHASAFTDVVMESLRKADFEIKAQIIWNKNVHALSRSDYQWKHEPCWYAIKKGANHNWMGDRKEKTVWDVANVMFEKDAGGKTAHPTQKPVELYVKSINNHTNSGEYIYEPFGGSGSSIIAAEKTSRRSLTMELDEKYCDVIIQRWEKYTGKKAVLELTNQTYEELKAERIP